MPVFRYFMFVGGALLALLLGASLMSPQPERAPVSAVASSSEVPTIRIHSDRKLPERIVLDTSQPVVAPPATTADAAAPKPQVQPAVPSERAAAEPATKPKVRETLAQLAATERKAETTAAKRAEARSHPAPQARRRIARSRAPQPYYGFGFGPPTYSRPMLVAQQPHFGFFNTTW